MGFSIYFLIEINYAINKKTEIGIGQRVYMYIIVICFSNIFERRINI